MRKILLLICVVAFTSANAQDNEMFDVNKYLKKKQAEKAKKEEQKVLIPLPKINRFRHYTLPAQPKTYTLPNGDRVITNPGYNMPIVVTDIKRYNIMPNAGEDYFAKNFYVPGQPKFNDIPNGAAELPLPKKLQELLENKKVTIR